MNYQTSVVLFILLSLLAACTTENKTTPVDPGKTTTAPTVTPPDSESPVSKIPEPPKPNAEKWQALTGWEDDDLLPAWEAFLQSCTVLKKQTLWQDICNKAIAQQEPDNIAVRSFFETHLIPHQLLNKDGSEYGTITGYYEPLLRGSRMPSTRYRYPLHNKPEELLTIDLGGLYPELKDKKLRGRREGDKIVPFYTRAEISNNPLLLKKEEFLWVDDEVELFFLQIQGSGRIMLEDGKIIKVGYAEQNGHPYKSIGKLLVKRGELKLSQASMQGIKKWGQQNPDKLDELLHHNARYIFFRELPEHLTGPIGSLGVPLTAGRSIAIDPATIPQGAPIFLSTTWPNTNKKLQRLMVAQDTGSAIKGNVRADFFWGFGQEAGKQAGKMKQKGKMWVLMPIGHTPDLLVRKENKN